MPRQTTVYNVLIASPSDVAEERIAIPEVILGWNQDVGRRIGVVLDHIMWEKDSYPEMGDRPQAIINKQIVASADIVVGVFWTRLGSPTGVAESGTVEEINHFVENGKPALLYFSSAPISPDKINHEQYQKVLQFKDKVKENGLYSS